MKTLMIKTHEAWLATLMAGFMSKTQNKQVLFDFSDILFRHFTHRTNISMPALPLILNI
jgi:hypothetical protein